MQSAGGVLLSPCLLRAPLLNPALLPSELTLDPTFLPSKALQADIANRSDFALKIQLV